MKQSKKNSGVTLIELIVVIAIMATLTGLLVPQFMRYVEQKRKAACVANREVVVNVCEKIIYGSQVKLSDISSLANTVGVGGTWDTIAIPTEYKEALKTHWYCSDNGTLSVQVVDGIVSCSCSEHSEDANGDGALDANDIGVCVADLSEWDGDKEEFVDPAFDVPTQPIPTVGVTTTPVPTDKPSPTPTKAISSSYWPYADDSRWDSAGRFGSSGITLTVPSGKFKIRSSNDVPVYYVLVDRAGSGKKTITWEHASDPSWYMSGNGGTEDLIKCSGTEWTTESIAEAAKSDSSLEETGAKGKYLCSMGDILILTSGVRYIYTSYGGAYEYLPPEGCTDNKCGNWYKMGDHDWYED